jgi:predicted ABC-type ATPase
VKTLYIIAGPNGAGKTTASYTILPEIFNVQEFVNADEIAKGLSPFNPDSAGLKAGRIMLNRINELLDKKQSFAFETTLSTKSYTGFVKKAQSQGYEVVLLFLALDSFELAQKRVEVRVQEGGHSIPKDVIKRRYTKGLSNLFNLYIPIVDKWILLNNSEASFHVIAEGTHKDLIVKNKETWNLLKSKYNGN